MENVAPIIDENQLKQATQPAMLLSGTTDTFAVETGENIWQQYPMELSMQYKTQDICRGWKARKHVET